MRKLLAIVLVIALVLSVSACSLISKDEDLDAAQVVATVNGEDILKSEVYSSLRSQGYQYFGDAEYYFYEENAEEYKDAATYVLDSLINEKIAAQKATELGLDVFTEDELVEMEGSAKSYYDYYASQIETSLLEQNLQAGISMTDEEVAEEVASTLRSYFGIEDASVEGVLELVKKYQIQLNIQEYLVTDIVIDEQEVQEYYDTQLETQQSLFEEDPEIFDMLTSSGTIPVYNSKPIHNVKHLLAQAELVNADLFAMASGAYASATTEELQEVAKAILDPVYEQLLPEIETLRDRALAGEDFDTLIAEQLENGDGDSGMEYYPEGYAVTEGGGDYMPEFETAAMALTEVGEISEPIKTIYGYHVLKLISITPVGPIPFEDVQTAIESQLLSEAQNAAVSDAYDLWEQEAQIERFESALLN
ncbi:MAG: peptidyl-prolyl cis-trans isomerase [Eubacteriales bacterium]